MLNKLIKMELKRRFNKFMKENEGLVEKADDLRADALTQVSALADKYSAQLRDMANKKKS